MKNENNLKERSDIPYRELLFDQRWFEKKARIIKRDNFCCSICGSTEHLLVHHKQYHFNSKENRMCYPWEYEDRYLTTLCESCHKRGHQKFKIPVKSI